MKTDLDDLEDQAIKENINKMKTEISKSQRVLNYLKKHNCNLIKKWNYGIQQYRVYKDGKELNYPRVNEDVYCEIRSEIQIISGYGSGMMFSLKNNNQ